MKQTITETTFKDAFWSCGRKDQFSYDGLSALFEWLEQLEEDCGEEVELDVVALCCEYTEYESALDCVKDRGYGASENFDNEEEAALDYLGSHTTLIEFGGGIIVGEY